MSVTTNPVDLACAACNLSFTDNGGLELLASSLLTLSGEVSQYAPADLQDSPDDPPTIDCRLNYQPGDDDPESSTWYFRTGMSDYDLDHRGHWGASCVGANLTQVDAMAIAADLLDQVLESVSQSA